jgi:uncharacterized LabA/DUF88 family protein
MTISSDQKLLVIIDGENFLYKVAEILKDSKIIQDKNEIINLNIREIFENLLVNKNLEIIYFGAKVKNLIDPLFPKYLVDKSEAIVRHQRAFITSLEKQKICFNKIGKLRIDQWKECQNCNYKSLKFQEKGVDVGIAIELLKNFYENKYNKIVLVSSDTDLIPAVKLSRKIGKEVIYVGFSHKLSNAFVASCNETFTISKIDILSNFTK